eukprot:8372064-Ditylum_brightwellii.AAC.1
MVKLRWSKSVHGERDAPYQIMLRAMDPKYCILLAMSLFLKESISLGDGCLGNYLFGASDQDPKSLNSNCYGALKKHVLDNNEFFRAVLA